MFCHSCGSDKTESDAASGTTFCVSCGEVLEENNIVAEVTFGETSGGKAVLQGSYAGESGRISGGGMFGRSRGREGQEQAFENGRQKIASIAHGVRLPERYRESAQRYYNLAVVNQFTRGRRSELVAAVCLYAVCRSEKSSHMLIDFSDLLQINVFVLGGVFLKLCRVLNLNLPFIDPSIYISRFAAALDFGEYTHRVAQDAVRIAQRMDRDWIQTGRRPAGICGACLLMAARMNGFRRTTQEIIYIVKVGESTIEKRLREFGKTESAKLSAHDFRNVWLETTADPPAFTNNRNKEDGEKKKKEETDTPRKRRRKNTTIDLNEETSVDEPEETQKMTEEPHPITEETHSITEKESPDPIEESLKDVIGGPLKRSIRTLIDPEEPSSKRSKKAIEDTIIERGIDHTLIAELSTLSNIPLEEESTLVEEGLGDTLVEEDKDIHIDGVIPLKDSYYSSLPVEKQIELTKLAKENVAEQVNQSLNPDLDGDLLNINNEIEEWMHADTLVNATKEIEEKHRQENDLVQLKDESLSDVDDEEIEAMILSPEEVRLKTRVWYNDNKEYLETMAVRKLVEKDKTHRTHKKVKKRPAATTPAEATKQLLETKKISKKINHHILDDMFESPESIEKIKIQDEVRNTLEANHIPAYEVVEESNEVTTKPVEEEDDDEDMDSDDMDDEEKFLRDRRTQFYAEEEEHFESYDDDY
ncbi:hypothetical protein BDB01DRAFT_583002 [Pilobolus umbonatus]|nr:hypothetical protein BDB01DRAFT_583002 [Pilobolus umbonatus]